MSTTEVLKDEGIITYYPNFLSKTEADELFEYLRYDPENQRIPWAHGTVIMREKEVKEPRFSAFLGERDGLVYIYTKKKKIFLQNGPLVLKILRIKYKILQKLSSMYVCAIGTKMVLII